MHANRRLAPSAVLTTLVMLGALAPTTAAQARGGSGSESVQVTAACGRVALSLVLRDGQGRSEADFVLDQNRNGRRWKLTMAHNGAIVAHASRTTRAPGGVLRWQVVTGSSLDTVKVTARRGGTVCTIEGRIASSGVPEPSTSPSSTPPPPSGGSGSAVDVVQVSKCYTNATKTTGGELLIKASSSDPNATLLAYRPDGTLIGEVQNGGGSRYGGSVMPYQKSDPGTVTVRSSSGGSSTVPTGPFQL